MSAFIARFIILALPVTFANSLHMVAVKRDLFSSLARPVHLRLFGKNKTWRGFVLVPIFTIIGLAATIALQSFWLGPSLDPIPIQLSQFLRILGAGTFLGIAYLIAELPNSYIKRKLGIAPGEQASGALAKKRWLFFALDRVDSALGCVMAYFFLGVNLSLLCVVLPLSVFLHAGVSLFLVATGIKARI